MEAAGKREKATVAIPLPEEAFGHVSITLLPDRRRRRRIDAVDDDDLLEAAFVSKLLEQGEMTRGDATVAREEICRGR